MALFVPENDIKGKNQESGPKIGHLCVPAVYTWTCCEATGYTVGPPGDLMCQVHLVLVGPSRTLYSPPGFYPDVTRLVAAGLVQQGWRGLTLYHLGRDDA